MFDDDDDDYDDLFGWPDTPEPSESSDTSSPNTNDDPLDPNDAETAAPTLVTPSTDINGNINSRGSGGSDPDNPLDVSNNSSPSDRKSPFSLEDPDQSPVYHLIDPKDLSLPGIPDDLAHEFIGDALRYYSNRSAILILRFCSDKPTEILSGLTGQSGGLVPGLIVGGLAMGVMFFLAAPAAPEVAEIVYGADLAYFNRLVNSTFEAGAAGYAAGVAGNEVFEMIDCGMERGTAMESLLNHFDNYLDSHRTGFPNPQPGPTPDMTSWNGAILK